MPVRFDEAAGETLFCGAVFELDETNFTCTGASLLRFVG